MLCEPCDPLVKNVLLSVITNQKWKAKIAVENVELVLKIKEIIGTVANRRADLGLHPQCWWSKESTINKKWFWKKFIILRKSHVATFIG